MITNTYFFLSSFFVLCSNIDPQIRHFWCTFSIFRTHQMNWFPTNNATNYFFVVIYIHTKPRKQCCIYTTNRCKPDKTFIINIIYHKPNFISMTRNHKTKFTCTFFKCDHVPMNVGFNFICIFFYKISVHFLCWLFKS